MSTPENLLDFVGRMLMSAIFVVMGLQKLFHYEDTQAYMSLHGVLSALLPVVIALELVGALALILGYWTRVFAFLLAAFSICTALLFHDSLSDPVQLGLFVRNFAMAGGMLVLCARGPGDWAIDSRSAAAAPG